MIDCHIHCALGGPKSFKVRNLKGDESHRELYKILQEYMALGIHALRDGGDKWGMGQIVREISKELPITYQTPIHGIYKEGLYGDFLGVAVRDGREGLKKIDCLNEKSADFIKIVLTGIMSFDYVGLAGPIGFAKAELKMMVDHAHQKGLKTMVHVNSKEAIMMAIEVGVDTIEHGYGIDCDCLQALSETGVIWVPTLAPFGNIVHSKEESPLFRYREVAGEYFKRHQEMVKKANQMGVKIALGSDSGASLVPLGQGTLDERDYLLACGLTLERLEEVATEIIG